jgi:hypothetical protein
MRGKRRLEAPAQESREIDVSSSPLTRRGFIVAGAGLLLSGCASATSRMSRPSPWQSATPASPLQVSSQTWYGTAVHRAPAQVRTPVASTGFRIWPRALWNRATPVDSRLGPMQGINRITVHHEGSVPVTFNDTGSTISRLQQICRQHIEDRGWGDIGYHLVIDRAGRVWEARAIGVQGAHVKDQNAHNLGIMVLGNFNEQSPSAEQLAALKATLAWASAGYRVPMAQVRTHRELAPTQCPGNSLQTWMNRMRSGLV